jgi:hypothetical protein
MSPVKYELDFYIPEEIILHSHSIENFKSDSNCFIYLLEVK